MNILTLLFTALALAAPAPGPIPQDNAQPPTPITHLYMCKDADFTNECTNLHLEISNCRTFCLLLRQENDPTSDHEGMKN